MKTLRRGAEGAEVTKLQNALKAAGYKLSVDGAFGPGTDRVVREFQKDNGLQADGIVGRGTWGELEKVHQPKPAQMQDIADRLFPQCLTQKYVLSGAQAPSNPPGMKLRRIGQEKSNCVLFTSWLISNAFEGVQFSRNDWRLWMCSGDAIGRDRVPGFGPRVCMDWGITKNGPVGNGPWLVQTFTQRGGHSYIVLDHDEATGKILTLESNAWINGNGWHQIGPLRDVLNPGPDWADEVRQTWDNRIYGPNVAVHIVPLKIEGVRDWLKKGK